MLVNSGSNDKREEEHIVQKEKKSFRVLSCL